jgi:hypothetical protein
MGINIKQLNDEQIQKVINDYKNGKSLRQIEKDYNVTRQSVAKFLEQKGIKTTKGNHYRKYTHNYDFFENIDTEEKAYWLGFMFADGYIIDYSNKYGEDKFGITLHGDDIKTLEDFKKAINSTNPITDVSSNGRFLMRIVMSSQKTVDDLISHGCFKQKSLILKPPIGVPENLIHHFIRGFFDGDGSIFWNKTAFERHSTWNTPSYNINITSTKEMIEWIIDIIGFGTLCKEQRREKTWYYKQSGNKKVRAFCDYIYKDATIYMERKYKLYQDLVKVSGN